MAARPREGRGLETESTSFPGAVRTALRARTAGNLREVAEFQDSNTAPLAPPLGGPTYGALFPLAK